MTRLLKTSLIFALILNIQWIGHCGNQGKTDTSTVLKKDTAKYTSQDSVTINKEELSGESDIKIYLSTTSKSNFFKDILPILSLLLGIFINRGIDLFTERKKIKKIGERWKAELSSLELPIQKQIGFLKEFLTEHEKEIFTVPRLTISTSLNGEAFNSLDKTDLIKYLEKFRKKKYSEAVISSNKINSFAGILKYNYEVLKEKFNSYLNDSSTHMSNLTSNLQLLMKSFAEYGVQLEKEIFGDPIDDPRYRPIFDLFNKHIIPNMENGKYEVYDLEKNFFAPLMLLLGELRLDPRTNAMSDYTRNCLNSIKGIKMEKRYLSDNIKTLISSYEEESNDLTSLLTEL
ncbi:MAG: hypothetical protein JNL22_03365 [Bacteroidales bacterium]|nr:hypothetical protein [Bacteroidales bacterium]